MPITDYARLVGKSNGNGSSRFKANALTSSKWQQVQGIYPTNRFGYGNYGASTRKIANAEWKAISGSADEDIIYNLPLLRVRSRDLFMGSPILGGAILTLRTNAIGDGLVPLPQIDGEFLGMSDDDTAEANLLAKKEFSLFADTVECDWNRRNTFPELTDLAFCNMCISGDVLGTLPMKARKGSIYDLRIRLIEADRVCNPSELSPLETTNDGAQKTFGGVELTPDGEVEAYWVANKHPGWTGYIVSPSIKYERVPAFGEVTGRPVAMLISEMERIEQRRGVPLASKCLTELKQMQRYIESTTIQNVIKSYFCSFIKSEMPSVDMFDRMLITEEELTGLYQKDPYNIRLAPGIVNWMKPGEEITFPINAGPDPQFEPFIVALCKFIGGCLGIPYEILLQHFSASYSASRAALLAFWKRIKVLRKLIVNQFCQPVYVAWMYEAMSRGIFDDYPIDGFFDDPRVLQAWVKCSWSGNPQGSIDPLKEIQASQLKVRMGVSTLETECLEYNGTDWRAVTRQQGIEVKEATVQNLTYIRNLDTKGQPILSLGVSDPSADEGDIAAQEQQSFGNTGVQE